jgi:hypothetical protein
MGEKAVLDVSDETSAGDEVAEPFVCQWCGEAKTPEEFKKNRYGLTRTCKKCHGDRVKETRARKAAKLAAEVTKLVNDDEDLDEPEEGADHATEVLSELLATIGRACLNASKRLSR